MKTLNHLTNRPSFQWSNLCKSVLFLSLTLLMSTVSFSSNSTTNLTQPNLLSQTITFDALDSKVYGDSNFNLTATASSTLEVTYQSSNLSVATIVGNVVTIVGAGTTTITASQAGDDEYDPAPDVDQDLVVNKKDLTVTADNKSREQCASNPVFTLSYLGFVGADSSSDLDVEPVASSLADESSASGDYDITVSGGSDDDYSFIYVSGVLTVNPDVTSPSVSCKAVVNQIDALGVSASVGSANALYSDGFEYNNDGDKIAWPHNSDWSTLTGTEAGSAIVSDLESNGGSKSLKVVEDNDFVLELNDKISGSYIVKWKMFIPTGASSQIYFSEDKFGTSDICILAFFNGQAVYFNELTHAFLGQSPFSYDTWFDAVAYFDLDNDVVKVLVDGQLKIDMSGNSFDLGAINFKLGGSGFYVDDLEYLDLSLSNDPTTFLSGSDNCGVMVTYADPIYLDCNDLGLNRITLTTIDLQGNTSSCESNITLQDNIEPETPVLADVNAECSATATTPSTTDGCAGLVNGTTNDPLTYDTQGVHVITWNFDDGNGNNIDVLQNVVINDVTDPTTNLRSLPDVESSDPVTLDPPTASDNCVGTIYGTTDTPMPISVSMIVVWTYTDENGNEITQNQSVIINPPMSPVTEEELLERRSLDSENMVSEETLNIYPNPNSGVFSFNYKSNFTGEVNIKIVDIRGQLVLSKDALKHTIDFESDINVEGISSGIYFLIINAEDVNLKKKMVINR